MVIVKLWLPSNLETGVSRREPLPQELEDSPPWDVDINSERRKKLEFRLIKRNLIIGGKIANQWSNNSACLRGSKKQPKSPNMYLDIRKY